MIFNELELNIPLKLSTVSQFAIKSVKQIQTLGLYVLNSIQKVIFCSDEMKPNTMCYLCAKKMSTMVMPPYVNDNKPYFFHLLPLWSQISSYNKETKNEKKIFDLDKCQIPFGYFFKIKTFHLYFLWIFMFYCEYGNKNGLLM